MKKYNKNRTAYQVDTGYGYEWHIMPRGKKRAPGFFGVDGPRVPSYNHVSWSLINELTEDDRQILLEAEDTGIFAEVWSRLYDVLVRRRDEGERRRRVEAKNFLDYHGL